MSKDDTPGALVPGLRFPEFRGRAAWQDPRLADLYGFKRTNTLSRDKLNYEYGTIRNIHYGDIHTKFQALFRLADENVPFVNPDVPTEAFEDDALCQEGDIVLADASEDLNDVGKAIEVVSLDGQPIVAGTHTILATRRGSVPVVGFGGYLFQCAVVRDGIRKEAQGAKVYGISANRISSVLVPLPPTSGEQQTIADCLGSLDDLIVAEERKLDSLRDHKKGLMQQLFPHEGETRPRLRFPEFRNARDWRNVPVKEILAERDAKQPPSTEVPLYSLTIEDGITAKSDRYNREFLVQDACKKYKVVRPGDIVYNPANLRWGAVSISHLKHDVVVSPIYEVLFLTDTAAHEPRYISYVVTRKEQIRLFTEKGQGTLIERIVVRIEDFLDTPIPVPPSKEEQQRVADCLFFLDAMIAAHGEKLDALRTHKRGLMQQLFPSRPPEGATT